ncbi:MAG: DUF4342 domain-containing protein [Bacillota bacterium]|jgi:hypothetical protein|nr:DUF4342 domain-containing protein [Bacillota bacterium]NLV62108.1 DUF4342 domain-containing protein [Clostridiaceae bacterium]
MITLEQVDQLRKRTNCSYEEAKVLLEKHNGNVLDAIVEFEKSKGKRSFGYDDKSWKKQSGDFFKSIWEMIQKGFENNVVIEDRNGILINLPVNIMILLIIIIPPVTIPILLLLMVLGYKISIRKQKGEEIDLTSMMHDMAGKFKGNNHCEHHNGCSDESVVSEEDNDDYNHLTIE